MKVYKLDKWQYWYDRSYRCWFGAEFDEDGNQVGEAMDAHTKFEIVKLICRERAHA